MTTLRIAVPSVLAGFVAYGVVRVCNAVIGAGHASALAGLIGGAVVGLAVLVVLVWRIRIDEIDDDRRDRPPTLTERGTSRESTAA